MHGHVFAYLFFEVRILVVAEVFGGKRPCLFGQHAKGGDKARREQEHGEQAEDDDHERHGKQIARQGLCRFFYDACGDDGGDVPVERLEIADAVEEGVAQRADGFAFEGDALPCLFPCGFRQVAKPYLHPARGLHFPLARDDGDRRARTELKSVDAFLHTAAKAFFRLQAVVQDVRHLHGQHEHPLFRHGKEAEQERHFPPAAVLHMDNGIRRAGLPLSRQHHGARSLPLEVDDSRGRGGLYQRIGHDGKGVPVEHRQMVARGEEEVLPLRKRFFPPVAAAEVFHVAEHGGAPEQVVLGDDNGIHLGRKHVEVMRADIVFHQHHGVGEGIALVLHTVFDEEVAAEENDGEGHKADGGAHQQEELGLERELHACSPSMRRSFLRRPSRVMPSSSAALALRPPASSRASRMSLFSIS